MIPVEKNISLKKPSLPVFFKRMTNITPLLVFLLVFNDEFWNLLVVSDILSMLTNMKSIVNRELCKNRKFHVTRKDELIRFYGIV